MRRSLRTSLALALSLAGLLALAASPALAARGHEFKEAIGIPCAAEPCAPGTLKEPVAVAKNEETGNLYVADRALDRVTVLDSSGAFVNQITGPSATGTGDLNLATGTGDLSTLATGTGRLQDGSETVTEVTTSTGAFAVGESISAPGIPPGTTISEIEGEALTLSAAATGTGTGVELTSGSKTLSNITGSFSVGTPIFGTGIPVGTTITALGAGTLTISRGVTSAGSGVTLKASNVTNVNTESGAFVPGEEISAPGLPAATTIEAVGSGELILSQPATAAEPAAVLSAHQDFLPLQGIVLDNACARHVPSLSGAECESFDPSGGDIYVVSGEDFPGPKVIDKFTVAGEFIGQITGFSPGHRFDTPLAAGTGVAVGPTGGLWVLGKDDSTKNGIGEFDNARLNQPTGQFFPFLFANTPKAGFALDPAGGFYLHYRQFGEHVAKLGPAAEKLAEREFPAAEAPTGLATDPAAGDLYVDTGARVERFAPGGLEGTPVETFAAPAQHGAGLTFDAATQGVYLADPAAGVIDLFSLQQPARPSIESLSLADVTGDSATLGAEVNPRGEPTTYRFEYGPCATPSTCATSPYDHTAPVPDGQLPGDFEVHTVSIHPQGLQPATAYHFRVVAENPLGTSEAEKTFTTQPAASLLLPDSRRWELVSPPDKLSGQIETLGGFNGSGQRITQAAAAGGALTYTASAPTEAGAAGYSNQVQVLSTRGPSGWASHDLAAPHPAATGVSVESSGNEYRLFSSDLSASVLQPLGAFEPSLSPQATEQTPFLRSDFPAADPTAFCASSCYRPLVTAANVPPGAEFGFSNRNGHPCPPAVTCGPEAVGATQDLSHLVLEYRNAGLTEAPGDAGGLYEWSAAAPASEQLQLLSVLPDGQPVPVSSEPRFGGFHSTVARDAISPDGSRVYFTAAFNRGEEHLYLRLNALQPQSAVSGPAVDGSQCTEPARACTIELDALQGGSGSGGAKSNFQLATADGSKAFFTDTQRLTPDSGATTLTVDLYEYDLQRPLGQRLSDLSPETPAGESAAVAGNLIGASPDGSYVYFAASAALAPDAEPGHCPIDQPTTCNIYLRHAGATALIAALPAGDFPSWGGPALSGSGPSGLTSRVSPDGRYLAFMSQAPLTGYDNRDAATGRPDEEVFLYHAPTSGAQGGSLVCASCDPTGARPRGAPFGALVAGLDGLDAQIGWPPEQGIAASLPGWTTYADLFARYQPRYLSDGGRLFFNAVDSLVPGDSNNTGDVYQYEPPKGGEAEPPSDSCTTASPTYSPKSGGCVDLISSGTSAAESGFLDASESGQDVFFFTNAKLSSNDVDSARDVYDAHACTASSPCPPPAPPSPPACSGDACQAPAAAPGFESPGTSLINGPENLTECPKGKKLSKGKCVKQKAKKKNNGHKKKGKKHKKHTKSKRGSGK